jgi:uncharacterized protein with von Willebrand factor type A (vWA) domain
MATNPIPTEEVNDGESELSELFQERVGNVTHERLIEGSQTPVGNESAQGWKTKFNDTSLEMDAWGREKGREVFEEVNKSLKEETNKQIAPEKETMAFAENFEGAMADAFNCAFEPFPRLKEDCPNQYQKEYFKSLMESEEYKSIHEMTQLSNDESTLAATHFLKNYVKVAERYENQDGELSVRERLEIRMDAHQGCQQAKQEVETMQNAQAMGGIGKEPGTDGKMTKKRAIEQFRRIQHNPVLKRIFELAGRFQRVAATQQRNKIRHEQDEIAGVELNGHIHRLLPIESAKINDPDFELDTIRRIMERQAQCWEMHNQASQGKGPIIVAVDESGSMSGELICQAKGLALALAWIAKQQKRWIMLMSWSCPGQNKFWAMAPNAWRQDAVLQFCEHFFSGGTEPPMRELMGLWNNKDVQIPQGKTDVILITDGAIPTYSPEMLEAFKDWRIR